MADRTNREEVLRLLKLGGRASSGCAPNWAPYTRLSGKVGWWGKLKAKLVGLWDVFHG